jgi:glutaredoxin
MYDLNDHFTKEEFYAEFGENSTFPQVLCNGEKLGGSVETIKYLREHSMIFT